MIQNAAIARPFWWGSGLVESAGSREVRGAGALDWTRTPPRLPPRYMTAGHPWVGCTALHRATLVEHAQAHTHDTASTFVEHAHAHDTAPVGRPHSHPHHWPRTRPHPRTYPDHSPVSTHYAIITAPWTSQKNALPKPSRAPDATTNAPLPLFA
jgi:hypothetical protein